VLVDDPEGPAGSTAGRVDMTCASSQVSDMGLAPMSPHSRWARDLRGEGRAVRVSAHAEAGFLIVSTWKADGCVGTVRLLPGEASELVAGIVEGLAHLAGRADVAGDPAAGLSGDDAGPSADLDQQLRMLEGRLATLTGSPR